MNEHIWTGSAHYKRVSCHFMHTEQGAELFTIGATDYSKDDRGAPSFSFDIHDVPISDLLAMRQCITDHLRKLRAEGLV
jgi:hypothetical protein